jgi:hypothetical protein
MGPARWIAVAALVAAAVVPLFLRPAPGQVLEASGPVAGASVRFQGACQRALTDRHGRFQPPANPRGSARITASRPGYAIAAAPADRLPLQLFLTPLPAADNDEYHWLDPVSCASCHGEIYSEWSASGHARAANGSRFLHEYNKLAADRPEAIGVCALCHAPTFDRDPSLDYDLRTVKGVNANGVHCDYCHKVIEARTDKLGFQFGRDAYTLLRPPDGQQLFFGPLDDAVREGETFSHAPLYSQSRYCAGCHEGVIYGVHVYATFSEWLASPARAQGKQCQSCHMAPTGKLTNLAPGMGGMERDPQSLASHALPGATEDMLKRCLTVQVSLRGAVAEVRITAANVGHRVPTGFIDRNLVLMLEAVDAAGKPVVAAAGPALPAAVGDHCGKSGKVFGRQLRRAEGGPVPFWAAHDAEDDTRLAPGAADVTEVTFAQAPARLRVRLLYRRLWLPPGSPGWSGNEVTVFDRRFPP